MQIVGVVPKVSTKGDGVFDYSIPPEFLVQIKIGVLVEVPFRNRKVEGIIVDIKKTSAYAKATADRSKSLKPIISIIDPQPVVDLVHTELAKWISSYYLAPIGKTLFENIVPPAKRQILKDADVQIPKNIQKTKESQKILIQANFNERLNFYLKVISKTLSVQKQVIILVPDLSLVPYFSQKFANAFSIIHADLTKTKRWLEWDKIRDGRSRIIIGSQSALFAPVSNLGLIIIDQEENETYKNDRTPRMHFVDVAEKLSNLTGANLVLGSQTPRAETFLKFQKEKYLVKHNKNEISNTIVDMSLEKKAMSETLLTKIEETLENKEKIILVINRKGDGGRYACTDCKWTKLCERCNLPLVPQEKDLHCFKCETSYRYETRCPKCSSTNLKLVGLSTGRIEQNLKKLFPDVKILRLENYDNKDKNVLQKNLKNDWQIAVVTNFALKLNFPPISLVGIIDADQNLNLPDFRTLEKNFSVFYKFLKIAKTGIIQTHFPESNFIKYLGQMDYRNFISEELADRQTNNLPPYANLIRLIYKNLDEEVCISESQKVYEKLKAQSLKLKAILGPGSSFIQKKRDSYRYQIILKYQKSLNPEIINLLKNLSTGWTVDIDPIDLL